MPSRYESMEQAIDHAINILRERFDEPKQDAVVQLAQVLYAMQERQRFEERPNEAADVPYRI